MTCYLYGLTHRHPNCGIVLYSVTEFTAEIAKMRHCRDEAWGRAQQYIVMIFYEAFLR